MTTPEDATDAAAVLIVDDEPNIRHGLQRLLQLNRVSAAAAATDADAAVAAEEHSLGAFVVDLHLAHGRSGLEFLGWLRMQERYRSTPVFVLTGELDIPTDERAVMASHQALVVTKGGPLQALVALIREAYARDARIRLQKQSSNGRT